MQRIIRDNYKQLYANTLNNLETYNPQRLYHMVRNTPSLETSEVFNHLLLQHDLASGG